MHSFSSRTNVCFTHVMTMLFVLVGIGSSGSYLQLLYGNPTVDLQVTKLSFLRRIVRERRDQAYITFDLTADFRKMWTWNINHMYVYVVAEYESDSHPRNEVVVWDSILSHRNEALLKRRGQQNKYSLKDHGYGLRGRDITLKLKYNILPYMGPLFYGQQGEHNFKIPENYTSKAVIY